MKPVQHLLPALVCLALLAGTTQAATVPVAPASEVAATPDATQWHQLPTEAYKGKQDDIFFVDRDLGFYVNGAGKIFRTVDGGDSWRGVFTKPGTYFRAIGMVDAQHGFAGNIGTDYFPGVTDETPLYETRDGGDHWSSVRGLPGAQVKGICAIDILQVKFIDAGVLSTRTIIHAAGRVGGPAYLLRSLDGGKTWANIDLNADVAMIVDVKFFDEMNGIVFAGSSADVEHSHAVIVATRDGGKSWRKVYESTRPFELTWKGSFPSRDVGYATVQNYDPDAANVRRHVVKTIDGGNTWFELPLVDDHAVNEFGVGFASTERGWVGTSKGGFETLDGGASWHAVALGRYVNKIRILPGAGPLTAYAIGADVYRLSTRAAPAIAPSASGGSVDVRKP